MRNELVSIIVPIYNAEKYLQRCIESILNQSYQCIEIILVDDGSRDNSLKICNKYSQKDQRIKVITKENGGVSSARNKGIDVANGKYIVFVDSDDWIPSNAIEQLHNGLQNSGSELTTGSFVAKNLRSCRYKIRAQEIDLYDKDNADSIFEYLKNECSFLPVVKIYLSAIIKENHLYFDSSMKICEDTVFVRNYLKYCTKISAIEDIVYYYDKTNENSATHKFFPQINAWGQNVLFSETEFLNKLPIIEEEKVHYLHERAQDIFVSYCRLYIRELKKLQAIEKIQETCDLFHRWLMNSTYDTKSNLEKAIKKGAYKKIYQQIKFDLWIKKPKEIIKRCIFLFVNKCR